MENQKKMQTNGLMGVESMNSCKSFTKKHPAILAALTVLFVYGLLKLMNLLPMGPLSLGIKEAIMAVIVFIVTFLFMGKEKVRFSLKGGGYGFRVLRGYFILIAVITVLGIFANLLAAQMGERGPAYQPIGMINITLAGLFVGVAEEFAFRGLVFGGLLQKLGNSKKSIILAAFASGLLFGVMHVVDSFFAGKVTDGVAVVTAVLKTLQAGIFGVVLAFVYYKTRNLFAVAALHSLDDFLLFVATDAGNSEMANYVAGSGDDNVAARIVIYIVFTLILVPNLVRCIKDINPGEAIPFDEDFLPRKAGSALTP